MLKVHSLGDVHVEVVHAKDVTISSLSLLSIRSDHVNVSSIQVSRLIGIGSQGSDQSSFV